MDICRNAWKLVVSLGTIQFALIIFGPMQKAPEGFDNFHT
jgi:hypothetical protein